MASCSSPRRCLDAYMHMHGGGGACEDATKQDAPGDKHLISRRQRAGCPLPPTDRVAKWGGAEGHPLNATQVLLIGAQAPRGKGVTDLASPTERGD